MVPGGGTPQQQTTYRHIPGSIGSRAGCRDRTVLLLLTLLRALVRMDRVHICMYMRRIDIEKISGFLENKSTRTIIPVRLD